MRTLTSTRRSARRHSIFMSVATSTAPDHSIWTTEDETCLVQFLLNHQADQCDGANYKPVVWNAASEELSKHVTRGGPKTAPSCKSKWDRVHIINYFLLICTNDTS